MHVCVSDVRYKNPSNDLFGPLAWELGMIRAGEPRGAVVLSLIGKFGFPLFVGFRKESSWCGLVAILLNGACMCLAGLWPSPVCIDVVCDQCACGDRAYRRG